MYHLISYWTSKYSVRLPLATHYGLSNLRISLVIIYFTLNNQDFYHIILFQTHENKQNLVPRQSCLLWDCGEETQWRKNTRICILQNLTACTYWMSYCSSLKTMSLAPWEKCFSNIWCGFAESWQLISSSKYKMCL